MSQDTIMRVYSKFCFQLGCFTSLIVLVLSSIKIFITSPTIGTNFSFTSEITTYTAVAVFLAIAVSIYKQHKLKDETYKDAWPLFSVILGAACGFLATIIGYLISISFSNLGIASSSLHDITPIILSIVCGILVFIFSMSVFQLNQRKYLQLVVTVSIFGFFMATLLADDKNWWKSSICALGMPNNISPEYYNFTLILIALLLLAFGYYLRPQIQNLIKSGKSNKLKIKLMKLIFYAEMIGIALVGIIPYGISDFYNRIHMFFGFYVFCNICIIILFSFWFFKGFPRDFLNLGYALVILVTAVYLLGTETKLLPYALAEIAMTTITAFWISSFLKNLKIVSESIDKNTENDKKHIYPIGSRPHHC